MTLEKIDELIAELKRDLLSELQADMRSRFAVLDDVPTRVTLLESERTGRVRHVWLRRFLDCVVAVMFIAATVAVLRFTPAYRQQFKEQIVMEVAKQQPRVFYPSHQDFRSIIGRYLVEEFASQSALQKIFNEHTDDTTATSTRGAMGSREAIFKTAPVLPQLPNDDFHNH